MHDEVILRILWWKMIEAILFDLEGVVVDTEPIWDLAQEVFLGRRGIAYDRAKIKPMLAGRSLVEGTGLIMREFELTGFCGDLAEERLQIVESLVAHNLCFIAGFPQFFEHAKRDHKTAIVTAMADRLLAAVELRLTLSSLFGDRIVTPGDVCNRSKPAPDMFLHAANRLGSEARRCVVIEDAPLGIEAAKQAGMWCIALATTFGRAELAGADLVVNH